jgi:hypothetical protein
MKNMSNRQKYDLEIVVIQYPETSSRPPSRDLGKIDQEYLKTIAQTMQEWSSQHDEEAYSNL